VLRGPGVVHIGKKKCDESEIEIMCLNFCGKILKFKAINLGYPQQNDSTDILSSVGAASLRFPYVCIETGWDRRHGDAPI
jgi:hypothetical protein